MDAKEYSNGEITVLWKSTLCQHSAKCVTGLHSVFNTKAKPWINLSGGSTEEIRTTVAACPSGALSLKE